MSFREVHDNIFIDWLDYREGTELAFTNSEGKKHVKLFIFRVTNLLHLFWLFHHNLQINPYPLLLNI